MTHRDGIASAAIGIIIALAIIVSGWLYLQFVSINREIACNSARSDHLQLEALAKLAHRFGVPRDFEVPKVPKECNGS